MLCAQHNWLLGERFDWWEMNRCAVNACPLTCGISAPKEKPNCYQQKRSLSARPWYRSVHSQVLQEMVKRVDLAFERFIKGDANGKRSGRPRFKKQGRYRTFTYSKIKAECIQDERIVLPKLGAVKLILHRPIPNEFTIRNARVTRKADGWYVGLLLECKEVPELSPSANPSNAVGIDVGLKDFLATSDGEYVAIPQFSESQRES